MQNGPYNCNITQFAPCTETDFEKKRLFCGLMETPYWYPSEKAPTADILRRRHHWFPREMTCAKRAHIKFHTDNASLLLLLKRG